MILQTKYVASISAAAKFYFKDFSDKQVFGIRKALEVTAELWKLKYGTPPTKNLGLLAIELESLDVEAPAYSWAGFGVFSYTDLFLDVIYQSNDELLQQFHSLPKRLVFAILVELELEGDNLDGAARAYDELRELEISEAVTIIKDAEYLYQKFEEYGENARKAAALSVTSRDEKSEKRRAAIVIFAKNKLATGTPKHKLTTEACNYFARKLGYPTTTPPYRKILQEAGVIKKLVKRKIKK